eukprot:10494777-Ditylum_brightwellii.AAC.1
MRIRISIRALTMSTLDTYVRISKSTIRESSCKSIKCRRKKDREMRKRKGKECNQKQNAKGTKRKKGVGMNSSSR